MSYVLALATAELRDLVVEALRARADTLKRAATRGAGEVVADKRTGADVRSRSVKLVAMLGDAAELEELARDVADLEDVPGLPGDAGRPPAPPDPVAGDATTPDPSPATVQLDTSDATVATLERIEQLADLAGLAPALVDGDDDPEADGIPADDVAAALEVVGS